MEIYEGPILTTRQGFSVYRYNGPKAKSRYVVVVATGKAYFCDSTGNVGPPAYDLFPATLAMALGVLGIWAGDLWGCVTAAVGYVIGIWIKRRCFDPRLS